MKLEKILDKLGSFDKNAFIKVIDNIISKENPKSQNFEKIENILNPADRSLKSVDNQNISKIFSLVQNEFLEYLKSEFQDTSSQLDILVDIIIRDGNCIMKYDWFSELYQKEIEHLNAKLEALKSDEEIDQLDLSESRKRDYKIYKNCLTTAYKNDLSNNREAKITCDELSILLTLSKSLGLSQEEVKLINYTIVPLKNENITNVINSLKNIGVIFYSKKEHTIYIADEMVRLLRQLREKEVADKFLRRTLKILRAPVINQIAKIHNIDRTLSYTEKIEEIIKEGVSIRGILENDIYKDGTNLTQKKKQLTEICEKGLNISSLKGNTLDDKIDSLIQHFEIIEKDEKVGISLDGYDKMLTDLNASIEHINDHIRHHFELQDEFVMNANFLLDYNIKPRDILDLIEKEYLTEFIKAYQIKQRGDSIINILENYKDTENPYLENYVNVAYRDYNQLKENGISIKESELGLKFEDLTKVIFEKLGFNVDEKLRKSINTNKDQMDILLNVDNDEVLIVECKTSKERGYNKFSSISRQLKSYQKLAESNNLRVAKTLIVAPEFSDDFIKECDMDMEMNLSLITATSLTNILKEFKNSKHTNFPYILFRDIVVNDQRIIKVLQKN